MNFWFLPLTGLIFFVLSYRFLHCFWDQSKTTSTDSTGIFTTTELDMPSSSLALSMFSKDSISWTLRRNGKQFTQLLLLPWVWLLSCWKQLLGSLSWRRSPTSPPNLMMGPTTEMGGNSHWPHDQPVSCIFLWRFIFARGLFLFPYFLVIFCIITSDICLVQTLLRDGYISWVLCLPFPFAFFLLFNGFVCA